MVRNTLFYCFIFNKIHLLLVTEFISYKPLICDILWELGLSFVLNLAIGKNLHFTCRGCNRLMLLFLTHWNQTRYTWWNYIWLLLQFLVQTVTGLTRSSDLLFKLLLIATQLTCLELYWILHTKTFRFGVVLVKSFRGSNLLAVLFQIL